MLVWSYVESCGVIWSRGVIQIHTNTQMHKLKVKNKVLYFSYSFNSLPVPRVTGAEVGAAVVVGGVVAGALFATIDGGACRVGGPLLTHCNN